jgi:hypothetical protein
MSIQAGELQRIAERVLFMLGVIDYSDLQLTYALRTEGKWKVTFAYEPYHHRFSTGVIRKIASFAVDARSGEVEGMWSDRSWK